MIELKPCWVCGCEDVVFLYWDGDKKDNCTVHCTNPACLDPFDYWGTEEEVARVWNMRAREDDLEAVAERLRVELFRTDKACAAADIQIAEWRKEIERLNAGIQEIAKTNQHLADLLAAEKEYTSRLQEEVERLRAALEWQPMETAPMDGTPVLVYDEDGIYIAEYRKEQFIVGSSRDKSWVVDHTFQDEQGGETLLYTPLGWKSLKGGTE